MLCNKKGTRKLPQKKCIAYKKKVSDIKHEEQKVVTSFVFVLSETSDKVFLVYSCQHHISFNAMKVNTFVQALEKNVEVTKSNDYFHPFSI